MTDNLHPPVDMKPYVTYWEPGLELAPGNCAGRAIRAFAESFAPPLIMAVWALAAVPGSWTRLVMMVGSAAFLVRALYLIDRRERRLHARAAAFLAEIERLESLPPATRPLRSAGRSTSLR